MQCPAYLQEVGQGCYGEPEQCFDSQPGQHWVPDSTPVPKLEVVSDRSNCFPCSSGIAKALHVPPSEEGLFPPSQLRGV